MPTIQRKKFRSYRNYTASTIASRRKLGLCVAPPRSIHRQTTRLDWNGPLLDFALDEFLQVLRRPALGFDHSCTDLLQALLHRWRFHRLEGGVVQLLYDRRGRTLRQKKRVPSTG